VVRETLRDRLLAALDDLERALPAGAPLSERIPVRLALGGQATHQGRGAADRGEYRQAAGAFAQARAVRREAVTSFRQPPLSARLAPTRRESLHPQV